MAAGTAGWTRVLLVGLSLVLLACGAEDSSDDSGAGDVPGEVGADVLDETGSPDGGELDGSGDVAEEVTPQVVSASFMVRGSVEQVHVWRAPEEVEMEVVTAEGDLVAEGTTDDIGSLVFRELPPGLGYHVRLSDVPEDYTDQIDVMSIEDSLPPQAFYDEQLITPGQGYITTRDGTTLSYFAVLPGPPEEGPYPALVNYSGYSPSRPGRSLGGIAENFCGDYPILCEAPDFPSGLIAGLLGYAVIGVNIRGTGCSGGAYDFFEPLQLLDGYDIIETVAAQDWVLDHKVGMVGLSFPGISQLYVASTAPPSLGAIAPFSVIANTGPSTLVPGGILNDGFAVEWMTHVLNRAVPYGHGWITDMVEAGDTVCEDNQFLHSQRVDVIAKIYANPYYSEDVAKPVDPSSFVHKVDVPVFMAGQWQDEQTGPHFAALFDRFTGSPLTRFTATNGVHMDGFAPQNLGEWFNFLAFYVAKDLPRIDPMIRTMFPIFMGDVFGAELSLPPARFDDFEDFEEARAAYEAEGDVRIIFETGAADGVEPGAPQGTFEATFDSWPIPETVATRWYLRSDGSLDPVPPAADGGASSFEQDPTVADGSTLASGSVDHLQPDYDYRQLIEGKALSFLTDILDEDMVMVGHGSVDLWLKTTAPDNDADLEVTITEVRPDGEESFVQNGWLRASHRKLRHDATELRPIKTHYEADMMPLDPDKWNEARVEIMPLGHVFHAGSRIRLSIDTPGDSTARWRFLLLEYDTPPTHSVAHQLDYPSSVVLPLIPNIDVPSERPPCHALRGQPCRTYTPYTNTPAQ